MIQFISSENVKGCKIVLWRKGNYQYEIDLVQNGVTESRTIEAAYEDAVELYSKIVEQLDFFKI